MEQITEFINFIDHEQKITSSTRQAYTSDLLRFDRYLRSNQKQWVSSQALNTKAFFRFLENEKKLGLKPSTLHRRRVSLKKFAEFLFEKGELDPVSVAEIAGWRNNLWEEIAGRDAVSLTKEEVGRIFGVLDKEQKPRNTRDKFIIALILETGISISTLVRLDITDVNPKVKQIKINSEEDQWCSFEGTFQYFNKYLTESRPELTQSANERALLVSQMGGRISRQGVWQVIRAWGEAAGLDKSLSPRVLRHTAVKKMLVDQRPIKEIQLMLGHGNINSTQALIRKISKSMNRGGLNGHE